MIHYRVSTAELFHILLNNLSLFYHAMMKVKEPILSNPIELTKDSFVFFLLLFSEHCCKCTLITPVAQSFLTFGGFGLIFWVKRNDLFTASVPASPSRMTKLPRSNSRGNIESTISRTWLASRFFRKSFSMTASLINCLTLSCQKKRTTNFSLEEVSFILLKEVGPSERISYPLGWFLSHSTSPEFENTLAPTIDP